MYWRPSRLSIPPQLGISIGRPKPRKLKAASEMITPPTLMLNTTIIGAAILGSTWRTIIFHCEAPIATAD